MFALMAPLVAAAEFRMADLVPGFNGQLLILQSGRAELGLSEPVEEALNKGIDITLWFDVAFEQRRKYWWNKTVAEWSFRRTLRYQAFSEHYVVVMDYPTATEEGFATLAEALRHAGNMEGMRFPLPVIDPSRVYTLQTRVRLDIEALPAPLRPLAYASPAWRLNSGWSQWNIAAPP